MKYYTLGITFLFISLIIIFISFFYYIPLTKSLEEKVKTNQLQLNFLKDKIQINKLELAAHLNPEYLEKLGQVYLFGKYKNSNDFNIIGMNQFNFNDLRQVIKVTSN